MSGVSKARAWLVDALPGSLWRPGNLWLIGRHSLHFCVGEGAGGKAVRTIEWNHREIAAGRRRTGRALRIHDDTHPVGGQGWVAVRIIIDLRDGAYEERITLWSETNMDRAIELAELEADHYAAVLDAEPVGPAQAFLLFDDPRRSGAEVFSLVRESDLEPEAYVRRHFVTGGEVQRVGDEPGAERRPER